MTLVAALPILVPGNSDWGEADMNREQLPIIIFTETGHMNYQYLWVEKATKPFDSQGYEFHAYRNVSLLPTKVKEFGEAIKLLVIFTEEVSGIHKILSALRELGLGEGKTKVVIVMEEGNAEALQPLFKPWIRLMKHEQGPKVCEQIIARLLGLSTVLSEPGQKIICPKTNKIPVSNFAPRP